MYRPLLIALAGLVVASAPVSPAMPRAHRETDPIASTLGWLERQPVKARADIQTQPTLRPASVGALTGRATGSSGQSEAPSDLALFLDADCPADTVDTEAGTFTRRVWDRGVTTVPVAFGSERRTAVWRLVEAARLFDYPEEFVPRFEGGFSVPFPHYTIRVRAEGRRHTIRWGAVAVPNEEAVRLARFIRAAYELFRSDPAVQGLSSAAPCM